MVTTCILVLFRLQNAVSFTHHKISCKNTDKIFYHKEIQYCITPDQSQTLLPYFRVAQNRKYQHSDPYKNNTLHASYYGAGYFVDPTDDRQSCQEIHGIRQHMDQD